MTSRTTAIFGVFVAISASATLMVGDSPVHAASWGLWNDPHGGIVKSVPRPAPAPPPVAPPKAEVPPVPSQDSEKHSDTAALAETAPATSSSAETNPQSSAADSIPSDSAAVPPAVTDATGTVASDNEPGSPVLMATEPAEKAVAAVATENPGTTENRQPVVAESPAKTVADDTTIPVQEQGAIGTSVADQVPATGEMPATKEVPAPNPVVLAGVDQPTSVPPQAGDAYVIGAGDVLDIAVWRDESLTKTVVVLPDGTISFPLIGVVKAGGKTVEQLKDEIRTRLSSYFSDLTLSLEVRQANSMMIFVVGKVNSPGRHPISSPVNVLQALAMAGGVNPFAKKDDIKIFRQDEGKTVIFSFAYSEVSRGNRLEENIVLRRGDLIVVP
ncbi:periplasmic polysaccharide biosynthesis/export protein [Geobacter metallireducens GS-15]|uniref:Periplasmic polysaccharide biosynthesis/export protein n=2 Tax=Geobacter metallireducens TaxID=28232 RepID=Q39VP6_GEOMG|nr:periplasmic polysaccharide biosynthesis/export protein [Geobacter metallireducens GS-15]